MAQPRPEKLRNPDRLDFSIDATTGDVFVLRFYRNPHGNEVSLDGRQPLEGMPYDEALQWLADNGYTVHRWPMGARAWKGQPWPIRRKHEIKRMRASIRRALMLGDAGANRWGVVNTEGWNLAFDL